MKKLNFNHVIFYLLCFVWIGCEQDASLKAQQINQPEVKKMLPDKKEKPITMIPQSKLNYSWLSSSEIDWANSVVNRIDTPAGYVRDSVVAGSFAEWLRFLPLLPEGSKVMYYNGEEKPYQQFHEAVIDIDIGKQDLQQCADATMRLRAEYQYSIKDYENIHFNFTSGDAALYNKWRQGYGIRIANNHLKWVPSTKSNSSYASFKKYMHWVFMYAGTASLSKEVKRIPKLNDIQIGDIIIQGGFPGHAVIVVDVAQNPKTGEKVFMLAQSYMPAQSIHILKNVINTEISPWYAVKDCLQEGAIITTQWNFLNTHLARFKH